MVQNAVEVAVSTRGVGSSAVVHDRVLAHTSPDIGLQTPISMTTPANPRQPPPIPANPARGREFWVSQSLAAATLAHDE